MIKLLTEMDREATLRFLDRDHDLNLVMIYDITHFGIEDRGHTFQGSYYGAFQGEGLGAVFALFNFGSMFVYAPFPHMMREVVDFIAAMERKPNYLIGRAEWTEPVLESLLRQGLEPKGLEQQEYQTLTPETFKPRFGPRARFAEPADLERLMELNRAFQLEYFGTLNEAEEEMGRMAAERMRDNGIAVAEIKGEVVSKAEILVRTEKAALIGGVFTAPEHRGKDLCFACMSLLCEGIVDAIGKACLNVSKENPPAQSVYRGIGFERTCDYVMAHFA